MVRVVFPDVEHSAPPVAVLQLSCNPLSSSYPAFFMNSVVSVVPCLGVKPQLQQSTQQSSGTAAIEIQIKLNTV